MTRRPAVLITHTHWDREWYLSLEEYRFRLVRMLDGLLQIIRTERRYHSFWLDGQTIPVEDYLAVRPGKRDELLRAIRKGKLQVGPWYVQPEEVFVAGEACLRNLAMGIQQMRAMGQDNLIGYLPDNFGHPSQMPQILRGFGIDNAIFWRGYNPDLLSSAEQRWRGADGSEVTAICLVRGYSNAAGLASGGNAAEAMPGQPQNIDATIDALRRYHRHGPVLIMNGIDHSLATPGIREKIAELEQRLPDLRIRHSSLPEYLAAIRRNALPSDLPRGELRHLPRMDASGGLRIDQKIANSRAEDLLIHYVEPLHALAAVRGASPAATFLKRAWQFLVKNHAHDTFGGGHANSVADDMAMRFRRVEEIGRGAARELLASLTGQNVDDMFAASPAGVWVFQPCGWTRNGPVEIELDMPAQPRLDAGVRIQRNGRALTCQILSIKAAERQGFQADLNPINQKVSRVRALVDAGALPACSLTHLDVEAEAGPAKTTPPGRNIAERRGVLDNGIVRAVIHADGTFDLRHRVSGLAARGLNRLVDEPEAGDAWESVQLAGAKRTFAARGRIERTENGPLRATYRVHTRIRARGRSIPLTVDLSLARGADSVAVRVEFDNTAQNHWLRASFPIPKGLDRHWAHTPFDVVERKFVTPAYAPDDPARPGLLRERAGVRRAMQSFMAAIGKPGALFFLSRGLHEYLAPDDGAFSVTLLRAIGHIHRGLAMYDASSAQCPGRNVREYAVGLTAPARRAMLLRRAMEFRLPPICYPSYAVPHPQPDWQSVSISRPDWVLSTIKQAESGGDVVVRLFSLADRAQRGALRIGFPVRRACLTRLDETRLRSLRIQNNAVQLRLRPREIATILLTT